VPVSRYLGTQMEDKGKTCST